MIIFNIKCTTMDKTCKMKFRFSITLALLLLIISPCNAWAANYITVATIGAAPSLDKKQDPQKLVDQVIAFWKQELKQVIPDKPDLIVLPEFCDMSGAGNEYLKVRKNQVLDYFASVAKSNHCYIAFGMKREEKEGVWRNSCVLLNRNGEITGIYDKSFPTIGEMEEGIKPGKEAPLFKCDFGKVAIAICFDLNFDELREKYAAQKPDLIIFSSMYHGGVAQSIWAYSCRSYFVASVYKGNPSEIRNPMGDIIASNTNYFDFTVTRINLDSRLVHLDYNWSKLTALKEKYGPRVTVSDPGKLASVLVTSEDKNVTVSQMIKEFDIELLDDYLNRAREFRLKN
jgi:predicted amidohydrolase